MCQATFNLTSNLAVLCSENCDLAKLLSLPLLDDPKYLIELTCEHNYTIRCAHLNGDRYQETYLHSKYFPTKEAEQFANTQYCSQNIVLYGFGLGYHVLKLFEKLTKNQKLIIFESNEIILRIALELSDYSQMLKSKNVKIISHKDPVLFEKQLESSLDDDNARFIIHKASLNCMEPAFDNLRFLLYDYLIPGHKSDHVKYYKKNLIQNKKVVAKLLFQLFETFKNKPEYIVSDRSSLAKKI